MEIIFFIFLTWRNEANGCLKKVKQNAIFCQVEKKQVIKGRNVSYNFFFQSLAISV